MKLTKDTKKLLNKIIGANPTIQENEAYDAYEIATKIDCTKQRFLEMINHLEKEGAIEFSNKQAGIFFLTEKGRNYKHINRQEMKDFLIKSILVPIIVTVLTTGILYAIEWLLQSSPTQESPMMRFG